jgi:hypothetical protein
MLPRSGPLSRSRSSTKARKGAARPLSILGFAPGGVPGFLHRCRNRAKPLLRSVEFYSTRRPHSSLAGRTPDTACFKKHFAQNGSVMADIQPQGLHLRNRKNCPDKRGHFAGGFQRRLSDGATVRQGAARGAPSQPRAPSSSHVFISLTWGRGDYYTEN